MVKNCVFGRFWNLGCRSEHRAQAFSVDRKVVSHVSNGVENKSQGHDVGPQCLILRNGRIRKGIAVPNVEFQN